MDNSVHPACRVAVPRAARRLVAVVLVLGALCAVLHQRWAVPSTAMSALTLTAFSPAYTVSQLRAHLAQDPARWVGRLVRVQGLAVSSVRLHSADFGSIMLAQPQLIDPAASGRTASLPLVWGGADPLWAQLRRLPVLGSLVLRPQRVQWETLAFYRIALRVVPGSQDPACYEAVLLDADAGG